MVAVSTSKTTPTHSFSPEAVWVSSMAMVVEKFRFLLYLAWLFSPMLIIPRRYSIRLRSESSAAALLKNPLPSVLA